jgi:protoporphyrinogen oxidase
MTNVAIIGGGIAGLSCAFSLKQRGIPSTVFEACDEPGGRCSAGPYLLGREAFTNTFRLADVLGLGEALIEIPPVAGQLYKGRVYHHHVSSASGLLSFKGLNLADKLMLSRMAYLLVRYQSKLDFHHPERGTALDDETVASFVKRELSQNILNYVAGPLISTLFFYSSEETSKLLYLNLAKYMHHIRMFTIRGGVRRLAEELCRRVAVETGRLVEAIGYNDGAYVVDGRNFSHLVVAVPGDSVLRISGLADILSPEDQGFFARCRYGRAITVGIEAPRGTDRCYALSIPRVEQLRASTIIFHDFIDPHSKGLTVIGGGETVTASDLIEDVLRIYPSAAGSSTVHEWKTAMPKFPPGRFREIAFFLSRSRRPGLLFCGDYLMGPFIEASVTTAIRAADAIIRSN